MLCRTIYLYCCYGGGDVELSDMFKEITLRLFCGGVLCFAAMIFAGEGSGKEAVRTCCACIMIALCLAPLKGNAFKDLDLKAQAQDAGQIIYEGLKEAEEEENGSVETGVAGYVMKRALEQGCICDVVITCKDKKPEEAFVFADDEYRDHVEEILVNECGISPQSIVWRDNEDQDTGAHHFRIQ